MQKLIVFLLCFFNLGYAIGMDDGAEITDINHAKNRIIKFESGLRGIYKNKERYSFQEGVSYKIDEPDAKNNKDSNVDWSDLILQKGYTLLHKQAEKIEFDKPIESNTFGKNEGEKPTSSSTND